jgi:hypothetical protein
MVPSTGAFFVPHTRTTALGIIAGIVIAGDARRDAEVGTTKGRKMSAAFLHGLIGDTLTEGAFETDILSSA